MFPALVAVGEYPCRSFDAEDLRQIEPGSDQLRVHVLGPVKIRGSEVRRIARRVAVLTVHEIAIANGDELWIERPLPCKAIERGGISRNCRRDDNTPWCEH